jgi:hypothetical protein
MVSYEFIHCTFLLLRKLLLKRMAIALQHIHMVMSLNCRFLKQLALTSQVDGKLVENALAFKRVFPNNLIGESISIN